MSLRSHRNNLYVPNECRFFEVWLCASRVPLTTGFPVKISGSTIKKLEILLKVLISQSSDRPHQEYNLPSQSRTGPNSMAKNQSFSLWGQPHLSKSGNTSIGNSPVESKNWKSLPSWNSQHAQTAKVGPESFWIASKRECFSARGHPKIRIHFPMPAASLINNDSISPLFK